MNGQISVRHTAAAWTDSWSVRAGSVGGAAARTSVPVNAQAASFACVKGQGKHRASPARPNAVRRALTYATSALAPYQPSVQPAVSSSGGSTANDSAVLRAPATATTEVASLYDHSVYVSGSSAAILSGDATVHGSTSAASVKSAANVGSAVPISRSLSGSDTTTTYYRVSTSGAVAAVATEHNLIAHRRTNQHWHRTVGAEYAPTPHVAYPNVAEPAVQPAFYRGSGSAGYADIPGSAQHDRRAVRPVVGQAGIPAASSAGEMAARPQPSLEEVRVNASRMV